jgi:hypothetical protein
MKTWSQPQPSPVRRDLSDSRSTGAPSAGPPRKTLLNDRRSTR